MQPKAPRQTNLLLQVKKAAIVISAFILSIITIMGVHADIGHNTRLSSGASSRQVSAIVPMVNSSITESLSDSSPVPNWEDVHLNYLGMQPQFSEDVDGFVDGDRYFIAAELSFNKDAIIQGTQRVRYTNQSHDVLTQIVFRLYANAIPLRNAGKMTISSVQVNEKTATTDLSIDDTVLTIRLMQPLEPDQSVEIELDFSLRLYEGQISRSFERIGFLNDVVSGGSWYPTLSVYEEQQGWWVAPILSGEGDPTYSNIGLYDIFLTVPENIIVVTSGVSAGKTVKPDGRITYHDITGPVRDHVFVASSRYDLTEMREVDGTRIQVWSYRDDDRRTTELDQSVLRATLDSLSVFSKQLSPYPYREFDVVQHPTNSGLEFPGLTIISEEAWRNGTTERIVAHEVAHQWFYGLVGNNQVEQPWLDESLATYGNDVMYPRAIRDDQDSYFDRSLRESETFRAFLESLDESLEQGTRNFPPLGLPVASYEDADDYATVYTIGSVFFFWLETQLGRDVVYESLKEYVNRYRYDIATTTDIKNIIEEVSGQDLTAIFDAWVLDKE